MAKDGLPLTKKKIGQRGKGRAKILKDELIRTVKQDKKNRQLIQKELKQISKDMRSPIRGEVDKLLREAMILPEKIEGVSDLRDLTLRDWLWLRAKTEDWNKRYLINKELTKYTDAQKKDFKGGITVPIQLNFNNKLGSISSIPVQEVPIDDDVEDDDVTD